SDEKLSPLLTPYKNKEISAEELQELRQKLTEYYVANGYVNSGAIIPDQEVKDGFIYLRIIEGRLAKVAISGNSWLKKRYVSSRLQIAAKDGKTPLNVNELQQQLQLLKQDPLIDNINASLSPGLELGEALLDVEVKEARPYNIGLAFNNYKSPSIGAYRGELTLSHMNLTGWGDALNLQYALTQGLDEYSANYTVPLYGKGTTLGIGADRSESVVVAEPFDFLDIDSSTKTYSIELNHPFYKNLSREFAMGLRFEKRESKTSLLGEGFAFSKGVEPDGKSEISVFRFSQQWTDRSLEQVIAARSTFNLGMDIGGATINESDPDGKFFFWLGQFQWLRRLSFIDSQLLMKTDLRLSADPLLPMEKFEIGGSSSVRGYRENQITSDNGITASAELRVALMDLKIPYLSEKPGDGLLQICPFFDFGHAWNTDEPDPEDNTIYSSGLGLRWSVNKRINASIYWGWAWKDIEGASDYDLQDDGFHFQIRALLF
ncbi:ShlB/FhaC/HecB family hemolysin secretion/activation protein, partial [Desulfobacterales bacterium HSG17]|nr:ShlB/FhaC/HecB family hemolysin secretion/activation protein [Desulfobacterales bacterium HSG17]